MKDELYNSYKLEYLFNNKAEGVFEVFVYGTIASLLILSVAMVYKKKNKQE